MCNVKESLLDVPSDTILHYLGPFLDAASFLAFSASCRHYHDIFQGGDHVNRKLWRDLCISRWKSVDFCLVHLEEEEEQNSKNEDESKPDGQLANDGTKTNLWKQEFRKRLIDDNAAWQQVKEINSTRTTAERRNEICISLTKKGVDVLDVVKKRRDSIQWYNHIIPDRIEDCLVRTHICFKFRQMDLRTDDEPLPLEHGAALIAKYFAPRLYGDDLEEDGLTYVDKELNSLANDLLCRLEKRFGKDSKDTVSQSSILSGNCDHDLVESRNYPVQAVLEEMQHFFDSSLTDKRRSTKMDERSENSFKGNIANYYTVGNSIIHQVLKSRLGIPLSLAVIYSAIVRRAVGIQLDPMGLPGHFMLSVKIPDLQTGQNEYLFIDAFDGGKIVSLEQVQNMITTNYQILWSSRFLTPAPNSEVWRRICLNILNCPILDAKDRMNIALLMVLGFEYKQITSEKELDMHISMLCEGIYECFQ